MEEQIFDDRYSKVRDILREFQREHASGRWYITTHGLKKASTIIGGDYSRLTAKQRKRFRQSCVDIAQGCGKLFTWYEYLK